jgi:hypothetical protein
MQDRAAPRRRPGHLFESEAQAAAGVAWISDYRFQISDLNFGIKKIRNQSEI